MLFLYLLATLIKPSNLNELLQWPQLLDLSGGTEDASAVCRRAPCEPLTFHSGHEHGACLGAAGLVATQYPEALCAMLAGVEELDFRRCNWSDEEAAWLATILPLCGRLQRLHLSGNQIGNAGACALANAVSAPLDLLHTALSGAQITRALRTPHPTDGWSPFLTCLLAFGWQISNGALRSLKMLSLDNNDIGDTGASALFTALSPGEGDAELPVKDLKALTLNNNAINDSSALALAGAISSSNTLAGCKVNLDGNPATKVSRKAVKKALKKAKKPA